MLKDHPKFVVNARPILYLHVLLRALGHPTIEVEKVCPREGLVGRPASTHEKEAAPLPVSDELLLTQLSHRLNVPLGTHAVLIAGVTLTAFIVVLGAHSRSLPSIRYLVAISCASTSCCASSPLAFFLSLLYFLQFFLEDLLVFLLGLQVRLVLCVRLEERIPKISRVQGSVHGVADDSGALVAAPSSSFGLPEGPRAPALDREVPVDLRKFQNRARMH